MRLKLDIGSPGIARQARRHERKLRAALAICIKRARTGDPQVSALLRDAQVEGIDRVLKSRNATISFKGKPLLGTLHQIYKWESLEGLSLRELSQGISWSLEHSVREKRRHAMRG
jgi:hypothetical protein